MAAINKDKQKALAALTGAALSLPGLNTQAAIPANSIVTNVSYGHYQESDNRMSVDVYHADAVIPLTDRLELAFSLDRDTYSGATPAYSLPAVMTNRKKNDEGETSYVDITSAASGSVTTDLLTTFFLLQMDDYLSGKDFIDKATLNKIQHNAFFNSLFPNTYSALSTSLTNENKSTPKLSTSLTDVKKLTIEQVKDFIYNYVLETGDYVKALGAIIDNKSAKIMAIQNIADLIDPERPPTSEPPTITGTDAIETEYESKIAAIEAEYTDKINKLEAELAPIQQKYQAQEAAIEADYQAKLDELTTQYTDDKTNLEQQKQAITQDYTTKINQTKADMILAESLFDSQKSAIEADYLNQKQQLDQQYAVDLDKLDLSKVNQAEIPNQDNIPLSNPNNQETVPSDNSNPTTPLNSVERKRELDSEYALELDLLLTSYTTEKKQLDDTLSSDIASLDLDFTNSKTALQNQLDVDTAKLTAQFNSQKQTFETDLATASGNLDTKLATTSQELEQQFISEQNSLTAAFNSQKQSLETQLALDNTQLDDQFGKAKALLDAKRDEDLLTVNQPFEGQKAQLDNQLASDQADLDKQYQSDLASITDDYNQKVISLTAAFTASSNTLTNDFNLNKSSILTQFQTQTNQLTAQYNTELSILDNNLPLLTENYNSQMQALADKFAADKAQLSNQLTLDKIASNTAYDQQIADLTNAHESDLNNQTTDYDNQKTAFKNNYDSSFSALTADFNTDNSDLIASKTQALADLDSTFNTQINSLTSTFNDQKDALITSLNNNSTQLTQELSNNIATINNTLDSDKQALDNQLQIEKTALNTQLTNNLSTLSNQLNADKNLVNTQFNSDKTTLTNQLTSDESALVSQFNASALTEFIAATGFSSTDLAINQPLLTNAYTANSLALSDTFNTNKANLDLQLNTDKQNLTDQLASDQQVLDTHLAADIGVLDTAMNTAINQYKASNPMPEIIDQAADIRFDNDLMTYAAYYGNANTSPASGGFCQGSGSNGCFYEDNFVIGTIKDPANSGAHLHKKPAGSSASISYHNDSGGIYIRSQDNKTFSLDSMRFLAPITTENPGGTASDYWEILGFSDAINPDLANGGTSGKGSCSDYDNCIAYQQIANGFNGTLNLSTLNTDFQGVNAVWIHYNNQPVTPTDGKVFSVTIDSLKISIPTQLITAWDNDIQLYETNYKNNTYNPALTALDNAYNDAKAQLDSKYADDSLALQTQHDNKVSEIQGTFNAEKAALDTKYASDLATLISETNKYNDSVKNLDSNPDFIAAKQALTDQYNSDLASLETNNNNQIAALTSKFDTDKAQLDAENALALANLDDKNTADKNALDAAANSQISQLQNDNTSAINALETETTTKINSLTDKFDTDTTKLTTDYNNEKTSLTASFDQQLASLQSTYDTNKTKLTTDYQANLATLDENDSAARTALTTTYNQQLAKLEQDKTNTITTLTDAHDQALTNLDNNFTQDQLSLTQEYNTAIAENAPKITELTNTFNSEKAALEAQKNAQLTDLTTNFDLSLANLTSNHDQQVADATSSFNTDKDGLAATKSTQETALTNEYNKQLDLINADIASKRELITKSYQQSLSTLQNDDTSQRDALTAKFDEQLQTLASEANAQQDSLKATYNNQLATLNSDIQQQQQALTTDFNNKLTSLNTATETSQASLNAQFNQKLTDLGANHDTQIEALVGQHATQLSTLTSSYDSAQANLNSSYETQLAEIKAQNQQEINSLTENYETQSAALLATKDNAVTDLSNNLAALEQLTKDYETAFESATQKNTQDLANLKTNYDNNSKELSDAIDKDKNDLLSRLTNEVETLIQSYNLPSDSQTAPTAPAESSIDSIIAAAESKLTDVFAADKKTQQDTVDASKVKQEANLNTAAIETSKAAGDFLSQKTKIALYRKMLNTTVPQGNPTVQRFQVQSQETRSMPQFTARYYFDDTTLGITGGLSDEPDFLSNFGSFNISHELNNKLTTLSGGYGMTSNQISRTSGHANTGHDHSEDIAYPDLNANSKFHNFNFGLSQVLSKNTLYQFSSTYTHQSGYLSNPYKLVYVRGEVTPKEYVEMDVNPAFDWRSITNLEMVSTELFREVRPDQRNMFSFSNQINHYIPGLDASVHFDYRFYADDWQLNSHTFELKWFQNLPWGLTVTPGIRYYSQSQAEFFAPYFLAPRADGHYSSDFRLSAFGDLSGGVTVSKAFARGIALEAGFEYVTHAGGLKLGGGGVGDYADFNYYIAHANLSIDLGARPLTVSEHSTHNMHHHHHGAPVPAGVMFGHMMNQADDIMIGYRYQYNVQSGSMRNGTDPISDAQLVSTACAGNPNGCLYKPTKMHMQMHMLDLMYAPTDWLNLMLMPQLMSMDMGMSQPLRQFEGTEEYDYSHHAGTTHTSNDIGDTTATALIKVVDDGTHHVHTGIGISAPTGAIDAQITQPVLVSSAGTTTIPNSAILQDYGMQLGSGTWDFKPSLTYTGHLDDWGWGGQLSGVKRLGKNKYDFAYGDIFQATAWGSYNIFNWLSASVRGVYTWQDKINGKTTQRHENISPVDFTNNYGGQTWDVGLGLNLSVPDGQFAGHKLSVEWLQPVATDFNGSQLDRDGALTATWSYSF